MRSAKIQRIDAECVSEQKQPNAVAKKPRTRRFLHSLLCCVKGDGVRVSRSSNGFTLPDHPAPQPGPYSAKVVNDSIDSMPF